jgi:ribulose-bisphosphate carboxylase small chain
MTTTRRLGTFSYLPPMSAEQVRAQVTNVIDRGLVPWIEFAEDPGPRDRLWNLWRLPMNSGPSVDEVLAEVDACAARHPAAHVRLVGYEARTQNQAVAFVVLRGRRGRRPAGPSAGGGDR